MKTNLIFAALLAASYATLAPVLAADKVSVDVKLFQFKPKELAIKRGTTVTWTNGDAIEHSVTAGAPGKPTQAFDSGFFTQGKSFSHTFEEAGTFTYFCKRHPNMQAVVKVE